MAEWLIAPVLKIPVPIYRGFAKSLDIIELLWYTKIKFQKVLSRSVAKFSGGIFCENPKMERWQSGLLQRS